MRIPRTVGIAFIALYDIYLTSQGGMTISELAKSQQLSISYLEQIFKKLRQRGLVVGVRGPSGGYQLAKPAAEITLANVVDVFVAPTLRPAADEPQSKHLWHAIGRALHEDLSRITIANSSRLDLIENLFDKSER